MTVVLTAAAGAIDVVTFYAFNQVFASTMTGNLVLLGPRLGQGDFGQALDNVLAILGYCGGLVVGTLVCSLLLRRVPWRSAVCGALVVELVILLVVGAVWLGADDQAALAQWKVILLVLGAGLAMGTQGAATRYIGPGGTPTSFLSGTVTNWVSGLVELHRPTWDGNSALRILIMIVAAAVNAAIHRYEPDVALVVPILLVGVAILLMTRVIRANHGGLASGGPELGPDPREALPEATDGAEPEELESALPERRSGVGSVSGRVLGADGRPRPAVLTLIGPTGRPVDVRHTDEEGAYIVQPSESGRFVLVCSPHRMGGDPPHPRALTVTVDGQPVAHDVVLDTATTAPGP